MIQMLPENRFYHYCTHEQDTIKIELEDMGKFSEGQCSICGKKYRSPLLGRVKKNES